MTDVTVELKNHKTRTSITLTPAVLAWTKDHADNEKMSVSQLIEDLLVAHRKVVEGV